uniref:SMP-30/Gluconolactonase/LRE-like region domain-containing protein n=1 Tax=Octopus bimaculoides TaxID=37653 RepID=A0A0L8FZF4_OCTBM|eukprot:XP_014785798.1 PREDICTED: regucalcin-like isoform X2 [Octopus bimaculoides]
MFLSSFVSNLPGGNVGFIIPRESGGYIVSYFAQIAEFDWESRQVKPFITVESDKPGNRFNDGKCDSYGRLWTGTTAEYKGILEVTEVGRLYKIDKDLSIHAIEDKINISNGMAWTSDDKTMFYNHSLPRKVFSYDYDITTGEICKILKSIKFPVSQITSCCFGGPNYDELYVTSSVDELTEKQLQNEEKLAGSVFKVTELGAKGKAAPIFQG